jgi:hypothetical protein
MGTQIADQTPEHLYNKMLIVSLTITYCALKFIFFRRPDIPRTQFASYGAPNSTHCMHHTQGDNLAAFRSCKVA